MKELAKTSAAAFVAYARTPQPPPAEPPAARFVYGLAQPLLGLKLVASDRSLARDAIQPAVLLAGFCALVAWLGIGEGKTFLGRFYQTFAFLAPLPSVLFAPHYARMAAAVRRKLGFGDCEPRREPLHLILFRAGAQAAVVAGGLIPIIVLVRFVPGLGKYLASALGALWALQWIVVDALDDARVLKPGETLRTIARQAELAPRPWFVRLFTSAGKALWGPIGALSTAFGKLLDALSKSWREEMALVEKHPALAAGFALTTAALLATPILNLFFRPIILVASAHLLGHLEAQEEHEAKAAASSPLPLDRLRIPARQVPTS